MLSAKWRTEKEKIAREELGNEEIICKNWKQWQKRLLKHRESIMKPLSA